MKVSDVQVIADAAFDFTLLGNSSLIIAVEIIPRPREKVTIKTSTLQIEK